MGIAEIVVAICLQAEPSACRVIRWRASGFIGCVVNEDEPAIPEGYYLARRTCKWRG